MKYHKRASIGSHFNNARQSSPRYEIITDRHWSARRRPRNPRIDRRRRSRTHVSLISYCISSLDAVFINGHAQNNASWKSEMHMRICHTYRMLATTTTTTPATVRYAVLSSRHQHAHCNQQAFAQPRAAHAVAISDATDIRLLLLTHMRCL